MVLDKQTAIEQIIKGVFELTEIQAVHVAGTIRGMAISNGLNTVKGEPNKVNKKKGSIQ